MAGESYGVRMVYTVPAWREINQEPEGALRPSFCCCSLRPECNVDSGWRNANQPSVYHDR
jgi:hypothetical protein